jgi:multidrug resistance efflux pump
VKTFLARRPWLVALLILEALASTAAAAWWWFDREAQSQPDAVTTPAEAPWVAIAKGRVDIEGGLVKLAAPRDGLIREVRVEEGDRARAGDVLATQDDRLPRRQLDEARRAVTEAQAAIPPIEVRLRAAEREVRRLEPLMDDEAAPRQELDRTRDDVALLRAEIVRAHASAEAARARAHVAEFEVEQRVIRAPLDGQVVRRLARPGDGVSTLNVTTLFLFAPDAPRIVRADLEERFIGAVQPGMRATVTPEADESKSYAARVLRIGRVLGQRAPSDDPTEKADVRVVECVLALDDATLLIGQRVIVRVIR